MIPKNDVAAIGESGCNVPVSLFDYNAEAIAVHAAELRGWFIGRRRFPSRVHILQIVAENYGWGRYFRGKESG